MSATYRVMLDGVAADRDPGEVAAHLARIFDASPNKVHALMTGRGIVIREGLDRDSAMRCRAVLERAGCIAVVNREVPSVTEPGAGAPLPAVPTRPDEEPRALTGAPLANLSGGSRKTYFAVGVVVAALLAIAAALAR